MKTNWTIIFLTFALFCYNVLKDGGSACFDDFTMKFNIF